MTVDRQKLIRIIEGVGGNNPEFVDGLMKWVPLICSSVNKISWVTGQSDEDVLQDILVGISEINLIYNIPLYRYKGRLYEKVKEEGSLILLKTPRNNKSRIIEKWVNKSCVEPVKKGKLESTIYREIFQQSIDVLNSHFTQKNGFQKSEKGQETVIVRSGKDGLVLRRKNVHGVRRTVEFVDEVGVEDEISWDHNPEDNVILNQYINRIKSNISNTASRVLDVIMSDPGAPIDMIAEYLDINVEEVNISKCEIIRNLPFISEKVPLAVNENRYPIYMVAD